MKGLHLPPPPEPQSIPLACLNSFIQQRHVYFSITDPNTFSKSNGQGRAAEREPGFQAKNFPEAVLSRFGCTQGRPLGVIIQFAMSLFDVATVRKKNDGAGTLPIAVCFLPSHNTEAKRLAVEGKLPFLPPSLLSFLSSPCVLPPSSLPPSPLPSTSLLCFPVPLLVVVTKVGSSCLPL